MKNILCFLFIVISFSQCKSQKKEITINEKEIIDKVTNSLLDKWHKAGAEANFDNYFNSMGPTSVFIGTDASENWNKDQFMKFCKPYFDKGKAWSFKAFDRNIYINKSGDFIWFDELLETWMGTCRGSGVIEKKGEEYKIKHYVLSVAIPNDDVNKVIEAKKKNDSIFLKSKLK